MTVGEMDELLAERRQALAAARCVPGARPAAPMGRQPCREHAILIDGPVLANALPPADGSAEGAPACRHVDRRFVFIDPFPNFRFDFYGDRRTRSLGFFATIIGALSELPREQLIRDNLDEIARRSHRIERMLAIVTEIRAEVETQVEALFGYTLCARLSEPEAAGRVAPPRTGGAAAAKAGYGHTAYGLLKVEGAIDQHGEAALHGGRASRTRAAARDPRGARRRSPVARRGPVRRHAFPTAPRPRRWSSCAPTTLGFRIRRLRSAARRARRSGSCRPATACCGRCARRST